MLNTIYSHYVMKSIYALFGVATLAVSMIATGFGATTLVGVKTPCKTGEAKSEEITKGEIGISVDENGNFYIEYFSSDASVRGYIDKNRYEDFLEALEVGAALIKNANEKKIEIDKILNRFFTPLPIGTVPKPGEFPSKTGVGMTVYSTPDSEAVLVFVIFDVKDDTEERVVMLNAEDLAAFIANVKKLPETLKQLNKGAK